MENNDNEFPENWKQLYTIEKGLQQKPNPTGHCLSTLKLHDNIRGLRVLSENEKQHLVSCSFCQALETRLREEYSLASQYTLFIPAGSAWQVENSASLKQESNFRQYRLSGEIHLRYGEFALLFDPSKKQEATQLVPQLKAAASKEKPRRGTKIPHKEHEWILEQNQRDQNYYVQGIGTLSRFFYQSKYHYYLRPLSGLKPHVLWVFQQGNIVSKHEPFFRNKTIHFYLGENLEPFFLFILEEPNNQLYLFPLKTISEP